MKYKTNLKDFIEEVKRIDDEGQILHTNPWAVDEWNSEENTDATFFIIKYPNLKYDKYQYDVCHTIKGHLTAQEIKKILYPWGEELICYCHATIEQYGIAHKHVINGYSFDDYPALIKFGFEGRVVDIDDVNEVAEMFGYAPNLDAIDRFRGRFVNCKTKSGLEARGLVDPHTPLYYFY